MEFVQSSVLRSETLFGLSICHLKKLLLISEMFGVRLNGNPTRRVYDIAKESLK